MVLSQIRGWTYATAHAHPNPPGDRSDHVYFALGSDCLGSSVNGVMSRRVPVSVSSATGVSKRRLPKGVRRSLGRSIRR